MNRDQIRTSLGPSYSMKSDREIDRIVLAVLEGLRVPSADAMNCLYVEDWPSDWERGKLMQRDQGSDVVPFSSGAETIAGQYQRFIDALIAQVKEGEDG